MQNNNNNSQPKVTPRYDDDCNFSSLYFDFGYAKLFTYGDGSGRVESVPVNDLPPQSITINQIKIAYSGASFQPDFPELGYNLQDELVKRYANLEHAALHLWIDTARADEFLRAPDFNRQDWLATLRTIEAASGVDEASLEEGFTTHIQLLANGIQPNAERVGELETATAFLALSPNAITAALAFVSFFRAEMRKTYSARVNSEVETERKELEATIESML